MAPKLRAFCTLAAAGITAFVLPSAEASQGARRLDSSLGYVKTAIRDHGTDDFYIVFPRGRIARVEISGDGSSDLDLYVYDENGNQVCTDDDTTDDMSCSWTPAWTGKFTVRVRNRGDENAYVLMFN